MKRLARSMSALALFLVLGVGAVAQDFFHEGFDGVTPPALPSGWSSSQNRSPGTNDFTTTSSAPRSVPHALLSTNATVAQEIATPVLNFSSVLPETLSFFVRRSSSHTARVVVEASLDGGVTFPLAVGDTLRGIASTSYTGYRLALPQVLAGIAGVRLRWRVIPEGNGATGTFRLDDIAITALARHDIAADGIHFVPPLPVAGELVTMFVRVRNCGRDTAANVTTHCFVDVNGDSVGQDEERFAVISAPGPVAPGDTAGITTSVPVAGVGEFLCMTQIVDTADRNPGNDTARALLSVGAPRGSVVVNELMYAPASPEPEWLELLNASDSIINLKRWAVSDAATATRRILTEADLLLPAGMVAVATRDSSAFHAVYPSMAAPLLSVGSLPAFNNSGDIVVLFDQRGAVVDSFQYDPSWGGADGRSIERRDAQGASTDPENWGECEDPVGATPGRSNSIVLLDHDLRLGRVAPAFAPPGGSMPIPATVVNAGREPSGPFSFVLYHDSDGDSVADPAEQCAVRPVANTIAPRDSLAIEALWSAPPPGMHLVIAVVEYSPDLRPGNNTVYATATAGFAPRTVIINEIMFDPPGATAEYVECLNASSDLVDLSGWKLADGSDGEGASPGDSTRFLRPGEFFLMASDSALFDLFPGTVTLEPRLVCISAAMPGFNNDGDAVILRDPAGGTVDSLRYDRSWHNPGVSDPSGRSLERINPRLGSADKRNWSSSADPSGGTPGRANSIYAAGTPGAARVSASPNPFSPDGDGRDDFTVIRYDLPVAVSMLRVRLYDVRGRLVRTLVNNEPAGTSGEVIWDGRDDGRVRARVGVYVVLVEAIDERGGVVETEKGIVVLAARL